MGTDGVTVYPLSFGCITTIPKHLQDLPAVNVGVAILGQATFKPANASGARDRVEPQGPDAGGVVAVDGESHGVVCVVNIVPWKGSDDPSGDRFHNVAILSDDIPEGVTDAGIRVGLVMHREADIHGTIQVGHGFSLAQGRAGHDVGLIDHATIIGTGWDDFRVMVDSLPTGRAAAQFVLICDSIFQIKAITLVCQFFQQCIKFLIEFIVILHLFCDVILEVHVHYLRSCDVYILA